MLIHIKGQEEFQKEVLDFDGLVLIDCFADWCGPCKMLTPIIEELSQDNESDPKIKIAKIDVDSPENRQIAGTLGVSSIPALFYYKNGKQVHASIGLLTKDALQDKINELK